MISGHLGAWAWAFRGWPPARYASLKEGWAASWVVLMGRAMAMGWQMVAILWQKVAKGSRDRCQPFFRSKLLSRRFRAQLRNQPGSPA